MRKRHRAINVHAVASTGAPHRAGEITESISREQRGVFERRNEEAARQMRLVMFDAVKFCSKLLGIGIKGRRQRFRNTREFRENFEALPRERRHAQRVKKFCAQPRVWISRYGNVTDVRQSEARFLQAVADRLRGKS